jgi:hypothetical protein
MRIFSRYLNRRMMKWSKLSKVIRCRQWVSPNISKSGYLGRNIPNWFHWLLVDQCERRWEWNVSAMVSVISTDDRMLQCLLRQEWMDSFLKSDERQSSDLFQIDTWNQVCKDNKNAHRTRNAEMKFSQLFPKRSKYNSMAFGKRFRKWNLLRLLTKNKTFK